MDNRWIMGEKYENYFSSRNISSRHINTVYNICYNNMLNTNKINKE